MFYFLCKMAALLVLLHCWLYLGKLGGLHNNWGAWAPWPGPRTATGCVSGVILSLKLLWKFLH